MAWSVLERYRPKLANLRNENLERCVLCHVVVDVPRTLPVTLRQYYVDGAGQLCQECYDKVYDGLP